VSAPRPIVCLLLVVAAATGCGSSEGTAATVDEKSVSHEDVVEELRAIRANDAYLEAIEGSGVAVLGSAEDSFDTAFVAHFEPVRAPEEDVHRLLALHHVEHGVAASRPARQLEIGLADENLELFLLLRGESGCRLVVPDLLLFLGRLLRQYGRHEETGEDGSERAIPDWAGTGRCNTGLQYPATPRASAIRPPRAYLHALDYSSRRRSARCGHCPPTWTAAT
jgi:hypothetical protein